MDNTLSKTVIGSRGSGSSFRLNLTAGEMQIHISPAGTSAQAALTDTAPAAAHGSVAGQADSAAATGAATAAAQAAAAPAAVSQAGPQPRPPPDKQPRLRRLMLPRRHQPRTRPLLIRPPAGRLLLAKPPA